MRAEVQRLTWIEDGSVLSLLVGFKIWESVNRGPTIVATRAGQRQNLEVGPGRRSASQTLAAQAWKSVICTCKVHCILNILPIRPHGSLSFDSLCQSIQWGLHLKTGFECRGGRGNIVGVEGRSLKGGAKAIELRSH